jgi:hypothetical protein
MTEVSRQVAGADEQGIHAFDGRDCFDFFEGSFAFQLHHNAGVKVCVRMISLNPTVIIGAWANGDSPYAKRRIASSGDRFACLFGVLYEGNQKRAGANIERALDDHRVVPGHSEDRLGGASAHCMKLREQRGNIVRCMFTVDDNPIKTRACDDLRTYRTTESAPQPNLTLKA